MPEMRERQTSKKRLQQKNSDICAKNVDVTTRESSADTRSISDEKQYGCIWKKIVSEELKGFLRLAMFLS